MYAGRESVQEVAAMAAHLPRGGAVGEWFGGELAVTAETAAVWELSHITAQVNSSKKIKPREFPEGVRERDRKAEFAAAMAAKYRRKRGRDVEERASEIEVDGDKPVSQVGTDSEPRQ